MITIEVYDSDGTYVTSHTGSKYAMKKKRLILEGLGYTVVKKNPDVI